MLLPSQLSLTWIHLLCLFFLGLFLLHSYLFKESGKVDDSDVYSIFRRLIFFPPILYKLFDSSEHIKARS